MEKKYCKQLINQIKVDKDLEDNWVLQNFPHKKHIKVNINIFENYKWFINLIKKDVKSQATGNIIIEYEMPPGNPSALKRTGATYWLIDTGLKLYKITPYKIWMCIAENREKVIKKENI